MDKQKNKSSLFIYAIALFAVAAVLIFLSYLSTEQHNRQEEFDAVTAKQAEFSISAMQNIENLQRENEELRQRIKELEEGREAAVPASGQQ